MKRISTARNHRQATATPCIPVELVDNLLKANPTKVDEKGARGELEAAKLGRSSGKPEYPGTRVGIPTRVSSSAEFLPGSSSSSTSSTTRTTGSTSSIFCQTATVRTVRVTVTLRPVSRLATIGSVISTVVLEYPGTRVPGRNAGAAAQRELIPLFRYGSVPGGMA
eukprot:2348063-Rhodomonas_salina.3